MVGILVGGGKRFLGEVGGMGGPVGVGGIGGVHGRTMTDKATHHRECT